MSLDVVIKIGDKASGRLRDGMVIDVFPSRAHSDHMRKVFMILEVPDSWAGMLAGATDDVGSGADYRVVKKAVLVPELLTLLGRSSDEDKYRGEDSLPPIDVGSQRFVDVFKDTQDIDYTKRPNYRDENEITTGTYTVGSGGADYSTWPSAIADVGTQTGDLTLEQDADTTISSNATCDHDIDGNNFIITNDTPHVGDPTVGHTIDGTHYFRMQCTDGSGGGYVEIKNLNIAGNSSTHPIRIDAGTASLEYRIHDLLIDSSGSYNMYCTHDPLLKMWNVTCSGATFASIYFTDGDTGSYIENIVVKASGNTGVTFLTDVTIQNVIAFNAGTKDFNSTASYTADYCASEDTTAEGSNSVTEITPADEFVSVDPTNTDWAKLESDSILVDDGAAANIAQNTLDIRGNARPSGTMDMGVHEVTDSGSSVPALDEGMLVGGLLELSGGVE